MSLLLTRTSYVSIEFFGAPQLIHKTDLEKKNIIRIETIYLHTSAIRHSFCTPKLASK